MMAAAGGGQIVSKKSDSNTMIAADRRQVPVEQSVEEGG